MAEGESGAMTEEEMVAALAAFQAANGVPGASSTVPMVWLGKTTDETTATLRKTGTKVTTQEGGVPISVEADKAVLDFQSWDNARIQAFQRELEKAGIQADTIFDLEQQWANIVDMAARSFSAYQAGLIEDPQTPLDILKKLGQLSQSASLGGPTTTTATETTTLSDSDVRGLGEATFQSAVGRNPADGELGGMATSTTATRTTTTDADGNTTSSVQNGANLDQLAIEYARSQDDYAEYQASTTYMNAFLNSIGAVA